MSENQCVTIGSIKKRINKYLFNSKNKDSYTREILIEMFEGWSGGCPKTEYITEKDRTHLQGDNDSVGYRIKHNSEGEEIIVYEDITRVKFI